MPRLRRFRRGAQAVQAERDRPLLDHRIVGRLTGQEPDEHARQRHLGYVLVAGRLQPGPQLPVECRRLRARDQTRRGLRHIEVRPQAPPFGHRVLLQLAQQQSVARLHEVRHGLAQGAAQQRVLDRRPVQPGQDRQLRPVLAPARSPAQRDRQLQAPLRQGALAAVPAPPRPRGPRQQPLGPPPLQLSGTHRHTGRPRIGH